MFWGMGQISNFICGEVDVFPGNGVLERSMGKNEKSCCQLLTALFSYLEKYYFGINVQ